MKLALNPLLNANGFVSTDTRNMKAHISVCAEDIAKLAAKMEKALSDSYIPN